MHSLLKVSGQTIWQITGKVVTSFSTLIILGIISRRFGEDGTGIFTLALTYIAFFTLVVDFGVNAYLMPAFLKDNIETIWRKLFGFRLSLAFLLVPISIIGMIFWPTQETMFKYLVVIGSVFGILQPAVYVSANAIFQSRLRYDLSVIGTTAAALVTLILVYLTSQTTLGLPWVLVDYSIGWITGSLVLLYFVKKFVKTINPVLDIVFVKDLFKQAWPISATLILNVIYFRLDAFILSFYHSFFEVGIYNLAYQIFQAALVLPTFIMNGYYPLMLKSLNENKLKFINNLRMALVGMLALGFLGAVFTIILSPFFINIITEGKGFTGSAEALKILSFSLPAFFGSSVLMWTFVSLRKYKTMLGIYLAGLLVNGILNMNFIPQYSFIAASWVTVVSEYLILTLQLIILYPILLKKS